MNIMIKHLIKIFFVFFFLLNLSYSYASNINFTGLSKLNFNDIQKITSIDLNEDVDINDINIIIQELYSSDLIYKVELVNSSKPFKIRISESKIIENIYVNGNVKIEDGLIISSINSNINSVLKNKSLINDIKIIKTIYSSLGYESASINVSTEKYSNNRINLIFNINEGMQSKLVNINFLGNSTYSDKFLSSLISSKSNNFYNIFTSGSNLNEASFKFDINKLKNFYKDNGFFEVEISYSLSKISSSKYSLRFNIIEGPRYKIDNVIYNSVDLPNEIKDLKDSFIIKLEKGNNHFSYNLIENHLLELNQFLRNFGNNTEIFSYNYENINNQYTLVFNQTSIDPYYINKITINGNTITRDHTIRSKLYFEPGDIYNKGLVDRSIKSLNRLKYINNTKIKNISNENGNFDIEVELNENKKTGNFLFGGAFSGDTGLGFGISLKDYNILGTGNELDSSFNINAERALFQIDYSTFSNKIASLKNSYSIFNQDDDLTKSFGYKVKKRGLGYNASFEINENLSISSGITYESIEGYSASNNNNFITDNIGNFDNLSFSFIINRNTTNDFLYPTNGSSNRFIFKISPSGVSDDPYYQLLLNNQIYFQKVNSKSFYFFDNDIGIADSLDNKLKTKNAFSLGGLNFKGFDFRGIGPFDNNIYLGGNNYFTTTIGYGSSFLFDDKDNINIKLFATAGSLWGSDYSTNNEFELRTSAGVSFDILTAVGPLSLSYAIPIQKSNSDKVKEFNFSIGRSF